MEALEWIVEAKKRCGILGRAHGWHWSVDEEVVSDIFPALEGQLSLQDASLVPNNSNALTLPPPEYSEEDCPEERHHFLARSSAT